MIVRAKLKKVQPTQPEEFFIVAGSDLTDLQDLKETCGFYATAEDALTDAACNANPGDDNDGWEQTIYRVTKWVEIK